MKSLQLFTTVLLTSSVLAVSCTTQRVAQSANADDVYNTEAQARVYKPMPVYQSQAQENTNNDEGYTNSDDRYDMDYASRIDRFYYGSPYRGYYDPYYNYYGYDNWGMNWGMNWGLNSFYWNSWNNPYNNWGFYGAPYRWNTWGPYSYYNPYWGGGYWGGGNVIVGRGTPNRYRPVRGTDNYDSNGNLRTRDSYTVPARGATSSSLGNNNVRSRGTDNRAGREYTRPATRTERPNYTPPKNDRPTYTPPANNGGSRGGNYGGSSGGGRPTRVGGGRG